MILLPRLMQVRNGIHLLRNGSIGERVIVLGRFKSGYLLAQTSIPLGLFQFWPLLLLTRSTIYILMGDLQSAWCGSIIFSVSKIFCYGGMSIWITQVQQRPNTLPVLSKHRNLLYNCTWRWNFERSNSVVSAKRDNAIFGTTEFRFVIYFVLNE